MNRFGPQYASPTLSRRQMLTRAANGFGLLALGSMLTDESQGAAVPHLPARARRVIFLFMDGGPSQLDLLDPKPRLVRDHGKPLPFEKPKLARTTTENLMAPPFAFKKFGRSGIEVSELLPHVGGC